ncbi:MAG: FtsH protease activity modulator HflK [Verrucomicrobiota bacterium]
MSDNQVPIQLSVGKILGALLIAVLAWAGKTSIYQVPADSKAIVLQFGKNVRTEDPGLNFKLPFGIEKALIVPVTRLLSVEFGFGTSANRNKFQNSESLFRNRLSRSNPVEEYQSEKDMVTGDLNSVLVEWVIQYKVKSAEDYLFNVRNPELTLRDASESVMREIVGDRTVDEVLTIGRQQMEVEVGNKLQALVDDYGIGLSVEQVQLREVNPPVKVKASFDEVNRAEAEKEETVNVARREYNSVVPKAKGEAKQRISEAEGYALKRKNEAEGDANRFKALYAEYEKAPEVTKRRIYLETMAEVMPKVGRKVVIDEEVQQVLPLLQLNQGSN